MFDNIPQRILNRMKELEQIDARDRTDGTATSRRLRQIPPETGKFIALLASMAPPGRYVEIGTSAGYSTLWIVLACRSTGRTITTFEVLDEKAETARETFELAEVSDIVDFVHGSALDHLHECSNVAFCFLDAEKEVYADCYEVVVPNMVSGGILVADNAINHADTLRSMLNRALTDD